MANTIRIKRSTGSSAPSTLANAELAYAEGNSTLYIGVGTSGSTAASILAIGGPGAYPTLSGASGQTISRDTTFSGAVALGASATATSPAAESDDTSVATTAWVLDRIDSFGAGTVTSVGLSLPGLFTVSGSPVTSSGTLSATLAVQAANKVWAGPTTGTDAAPTFRSLVASDIPDLSATYLTSETYTGTVTSVALSLPGVFTVSGSPVTSSGTLTASLATQAANKVWAGPTTGSDAAPAFRSLVAGDLPSHTHAISDTTGLQTALDAKAPLDSPALTGTPTAPTAAAATNTTQIATTAFVQTAVAGIVDTAPTTLDTLNELAAALGDDANFATTVSTSIGEKLAKASNLSDLASASTARTNLGLGSMATQAANNVAITGGTIDGITIDGGSWS